MKGQKYRFLVVLALVFVVYKLYTYTEGYQNRQCSYYSNCASCVANNNVGDPENPCWWSNDKDRYGKTKGCSAFYDVGFSRTCSVPAPSPDPLPDISPGPTIDPSPGPSSPSQSSCPLNTSCSDCVNSDCFWSNLNQKCSFFKLNGYNSVCPATADCPKYNMINVPTYIKT